MRCVCRSIDAPLGALLASLRASVDVTADASAQAVLAAAAALPGPPWAPDPAWLGLGLPVPRLSLDAMAVLSALAQLRADAMATLGLDLLDPAQAAALPGLVVSLNARLAAVAGGVPDAGPWLRLAALLAAADAVLAASASATAQVSASASAQFGGLPALRWSAFLGSIQALSPLIGIAAHLGVSLDAHATVTAQLAAAIRALRGLVLPSLSAVASAHALIALLGALGRVRASLGLDPLAMGAAALTAAVRARVSAAASVAARLSASLGAPGFGVGIGAPGLVAPAAVVQAAASAGVAALAAISWNVPARASIGVLQSGPTALALTAALSASLGVSVAASPCGACDLLRA